MPDCEHCPAKLTIIRRSRLDVLAIDIIGDKTVKEPAEFPTECQPLVAARTCKAAQILEDILND